MVAEFCLKCPATVTACLAQTQFRWVEEEEGEPGGSLDLLEEVEVEVEEEEVEVEDPPC